MENGFVQIPVHRYEELTEVERAFKSLETDPKSFVVVERDWRGRHMISLTPNEIVSDANDKLNRCVEILDGCRDDLRTIQNSKIIRLLQWIKLIKTFPA